MFVRAIILTWTTFNYSFEKWTNALDARLDCLINGPVLITAFKTLTIWIEKNYVYERKWRKLYFLTASFKQHQLKKDNTGHKFDLLSFDRLIVVVYWTNLFFFAEISQPISLFQILELMGKNKENVRAINLTWSVSFSCGLDISTDLSVVFANFSTSFRTNTKSEIFCELSEP